MVVHLKLDELAIYHPITLDPRVLFTFLIKSKVFIPIKILLADNVVSDYVMFLVMPLSP